MPVQSFVRRVNRVIAVASLPWHLLDHGLFASRCLNARAYNLIAQHVMVVFYDSTCSLRFAGTPTATYRVARSDADWNAGVTIPHKISSSS